MALMAGRQNDSSGQEQKQGRRRNIKEICNRKRRDWEGNMGMEKLADKLTEKLIAKMK